MVMKLIVEQMRLLKMFDCRRPFGAFVTGYGDPRADARGYLPSPLGGGEKFVATFTVYSLPRRGRNKSAQGKALRRSRVASPWVTNAEEDQP